MRLRQLTAWQAGMRTAEFGKIATDWFKMAKRPCLKRSCKQLAYQLTAA
jgi:hypothetical protein